MNRHLRAIRRRRFGWRDLTANLLAIAAAILVGLFLIGAIQP